MNCSNSKCKRASAYDDGCCFHHTADVTKPTTAAGRYRLVSREIRRREAVRRAIVESRRKRLSDTVGDTHAAALLLDADYSRCVLDCLVAS